MSEPKKENEPEKVSRRNYLQLAGGTIAGLVVGGALGYLAKPTVMAPAETVTSTVTQALTSTVTASVQPTAVATNTATGAAAAAINWRQFAGSEITVGWQENSAADVLGQMVGDFQTLTGIKVNFDAMPSTGMRDKIELDLSTGTQIYDAAWVNFPEPGWYKNGWLTPLSQFVQDTSLTDDAYFKYEGYPKGFIDPDTINGAGPYAIPYMGEVHLLIYRKDVFEQNNVTVPTTVDELVDTAAKLKTSDMYGIVLRGLKGWNELEYIWLGLLAGQGGEILDDKFVPQLNSSAAINAADIYCNKLLRQSGPPGAATMDHMACAQAFAAGKAAMFIDSNYFPSMFEDPSLSQVVGKEASAPDLPDGWVSNMWFAGPGIPAKSKNPKAAWLFIEWSNSPDIEWKVLQAAPFANVARTQFFTDPAMRPAFQAAQKLPDDWFVATANVAAKARSLAPMVPEYTDIADIISLALNDVMGGKDAAAAMGDANSKVYDLMNKAGYYKS